MKTNVLMCMGLVVFMTATAFAATVPEINPGSMGAPLALLGGAILIVRSRIRR